MPDTAATLATLLTRAAEQLRRFGLNPEADELAALAGQTANPCVVAVIGRMKAGKSTLINALLGENLARVGVTETTATINVFRFGQPNPERPVRCHWRSGAVTDEPRSFLDALQGHDAETLRRAEAIDRLEYLLPNPFLERVTLVDTPGTGAAVSEHTARTAEFLRLRTRHDEATRQLAESADAVVYVVGPVARATDRVFLDEFHGMAGCRPHARNALGVLAKVDVSPAVFADRERLCGGIASQLRSQLSGVLPVSAGIDRALDSLLAGDGEGFRRLVRVVRALPPEWREKLLESEELFRDLDRPACPVPASERQAALGELPWGVFVALATVAAAGAPEPEMIARLRELAGMEHLRAVLDRLFVRRGADLRCHRILLDARRVLERVKFRRVPELTGRAEESRAKRVRLLAFVRSADGDPRAASELEALIESACGPTADPGALTAVVGTLDAELGQLGGSLAERATDFDALQKLDPPAPFTEPERQELRALFGLYGMEPAERLTPGNDPPERQRFWLGVGQMARDPTRREVARLAVSHYGRLLARKHHSPPGDGP